MANLMMNGLDDIAKWHQGDLFNALPEAEKSSYFDVILANPPYWPAHNKLLFHAGGLDGEAVTKRVVTDGTPLLKTNGLMFIVTPIFNTDKAGPGSAPVLERIRSWGWPASMKSVVLHGSTREDKDFYDLFNAKTPPITREMLDDVGIINAAEGAFDVRALQHDVKAPTSFGNLVPVVAGGFTTASLPCSSYRLKFSTSVCTVRHQRA